MINLAKYILRKLRPFLPFYILRFVVNLYFNRHFIKSYSQYGEDLIIVDFFKRYFLKSSKLNLEMSYLDIGAFHPIMISNTHLLDMLGFKGEAVDLDEFKLKLFKKKRKNLTSYKVAAVVPGYYTKKNFVNVYKFNKPFSELDTLNLEIAKERETKLKLKYKKVQIEQIGINNLLQEKNYDFINIDIEGLDEELILSLDFKNIYSPKLICFEVYTPLSNRPVYTFLEKNGYCHLFTTGGSVAYYKKL